jgi:16S rRNA (cytosine1402-N4)-methyltransferase
MSSKGNPTAYHNSVLVKEVLAYLHPRPAGIYVDVTFGGGGHTRAILEHENRCTVIALDWDKNALEINAPPLKAEFGDRFHTVWGSFAHLTRLLKKLAVSNVDGILADFGTSQYQIFQSPGFSFSIDSPLDMRMSKGHHTITAADILRRSSEEELINIFKIYGEERYARAIARAIIKVRAKKPLETTKELATLVESSTPRRTTGKIHPATKIFQALRIVVNKELDHIHSFLSQTPQALNPGGRLVCISFHSLEDRMVKHFFKEQEEIFTILTPKVVTASTQELANNNSARSAKLRAAEKKRELVDKTVILE